jgi:plastocyanin
MKKFAFFISAIITLVCIMSVKNVQATKWVVNVQNFSFSPSNLPSMAVGDTVRWVWINGSHTTTSTTIPAGAATWDSPINSTTTSFEYKVTLAGTYNYKCTPHASMGMVGSFTAGAAPTLNVLPPNQNVTALAGTATFNVTSNTSWTASSDVNWCTATPSGSGNGTISAVFSENVSVNQRIATITVTVSGLSPQTVTVTQEASSGVSVGEISNDNSIRIYPNPTAGNFKMVPDESKSQAFTVDILNLAGQIIFSHLFEGQREYAFDLTSAPEGCYFIQIKSENNVITKKLIISR